MFEIPYNIGTLLRLQRVDIKQCLQKSYVRRTFARLLRYLGVEFLTINYW